MAPWSDDLTLQKCNHSQEICALTSWDLWWKCLLYWACHWKCIFADPIQTSHAYHRFCHCYETLTFCSLLARWNLKKSSPRPYVFTVHFWLGNVLRATTARTFSTTQLSKLVRTCGAFTVLTWDRASRHSPFHFLTNSTLKSALNPRFLSLSLSSPSLAVRSPCPSCARKREISNYKWRVHEITAGCCWHLYNHAGTYCIESPLD